MLSIFIFLFSILIKLAHSQINTFDELVEINYDLKIENGEATITLPLSVPKGVQSLTPKLSLFYNSNQYLVNKEIGIGWQISGLSEISRCPKSFFYDGRFDPIKYNYLDSLCYNGQRLKLISGQYGFNSSEYKTDIDNYEKIISLGDSGFGPLSFRVLTKDNLIYTFGGTNDSTLSPIAANNTNLKTISRWLISKIEDYSGNSIQFSYLKERNYCYLNIVKYANRLISFIYESRTDPQTKYYANMIDSHINKRLKTIQIKVNDTEIKRYVLDYIKYGSTELSMLKNVSSCVSTYCSKPLVFDYDIQETKFSKSVYVNDICGLSDTCELKQIADMNGDGLKDIIAFGSDGIYVSLNTGNSFLPAEKWSIQFTKQTGWDSTKHYRYIIDMNRDGLPDVAGFWEDGVYVALNKNGYFNQYNRWSNNSGYNQGYRIPTNLRYFTDINNDGFPDVVSFSADGIYTEFNFGSYFKGFTRLTSDDSYQSSAGWGSSLPTYIDDMNGDGLKEIIGIANALFISELFNWTAIRQVKGVNNFLYSNGWRVGTHTRFLADMNNDNLADIIGFTLSQGFFGISSIDDSLNNWYNVSNSNYYINGFGTVESRYQFARDVNGDNLLDIISFDCDGVYVSINNGNGMLKSEIWVSDLKSCDTDTRDAQDMNGDLIPEFIGFYGKNVKISYNLNKKSKLIKVTDLYGNTKTLYHSNLAIQNNFSYNQNITSTSNYTFHGLNVDIITSLASSDGLGGTNIINYNYGPYSCGTIQGKYDCAFSWIKSINQETNIVTIDEFNQEYPLTGTIKRKRVFYGSFLLSDTVFYFVFSKRTNTDILRVYLEKKSNNVYDLNNVYLKTEVFEYLYDDYGNVYKLTENITDNKITYSRVKTYQFRNDEIRWFIGELQNKKEITTKIENSKILTVSQLIEEIYEFNQQNRLLAKKISQPNDFITLEESFSYDNFGNMIMTIKNSSKTNEVRRNYYTYDSFGVNILVKKNDLLHQESYDYDLNDNVIQYVDINKLVTIYNYDQLGRKIKEFEPQGRNTNWTYEWDKPQTLKNSIYKITSIVDDTIKQTTYYDSLNRIIRKQKKSANGEDICEDSIYNSFGKIELQSLPYKQQISQPKYVIFEYDALFREVNKTEGFDKGQAIFTEYIGLKTIKSDRMGRITISTRNILDQIISVEDAAGTIAYYEYDLFGNMIKIIDPQGSTITMGYNVNGQKTFKNDTYLGLTYYTYNAFNELVLTKYSNGTEIKMIRDTLGRIILRSEVEGNTSWVYDTAQNGIGKISKILAPSNYYTEMKYDNFSRLIDQKISYGDNSNYSILIDYDRLGRVITETYPSNQKIYNCYNSYGYLVAKSLDDANCNSYTWKLIETEANGNVKKERYGNDVINEYSYNDGSQITNINTYNYPSNKILRQYEYEYDRRQNLISKTDNDIFGMFYEQQFEYDILNRLVLASTFENANNINRKVIESSAWMYDSMGNIIFTNDETSTSSLYQYDKIKKQQAIKIGSQTLNYDDYGNVVETDLYKVYWNSFFKAKQIQTNSQKILFDYGPERELTVKTVIFNITNTTVHYIGGNYEKWIIRKPGDTQIIEKYFVKVLDKLVATKIVSQLLPKPVILYSHSDAFGSVESTTDSNGLLVLKYKYSPFGKSKVVFSNLTSNIQSVLNSGFTGHENIDGERLINMNGRIYDNVYLRFLSPDPFIQDIYNIQNLNRYSYALNNPFKYKDPTGFFWKKIFKIAVAIVAAVVTAGAALAVIAPVVVSAIGVTSAIASSVVTGAVVGSTSAFASSMVMTDGNLKLSMKAAAFGGLSGGIAGGFSSFLSSEFQPIGYQKDLIGAVSNKIGDVASSAILKKDLSNNLELSLLSFAAANIYKTVVGYEATIESGGAAVRKDLFQPPVQGANNIGTQGGLLNPNGLFNEGGIVSRAANKIGGLNAIAGLHDKFQISLPGITRDIFNVPGMPIAATFTYAALYNQIKCPYC